MTRRLLLLASAASYSRILGANSRPQVGLIGCGNPGTRHLRLYLKPIVYTVAKERARGLVARQDIHAVYVVTPEHWRHPIARLAPLPRRRPAPPSTAMRPLLTFRTAIFRSLRSPSSGRSSSKLPARPPCPSRLPDDERSFDSKLQNITANPPPREGYEGAGENYPEKN